MYSKTFTPAEVAKMKADMKIKNELLGGDNVGLNSPNRWVGEACELAFEDYLVKKDIAYTYHVDTKHKDDIDFTVSWLKIDVKGSSTRKPIGEDYACWVCDDQYAKITRDGYPVNYLMFGSYNLNTNTATIMGYMSLEDFKVKNKRWTAGQVRCGYELRIPDYAVEKKQIIDLPDLK